MASDPALEPAPRADNFCQACAVRNRAICADLDREEIALLNRIGRRRRLAPGEHLLWEGNEAPLVANVVEGVLKLSSATADGREQILGLAYPSDFLGRPFGEAAPYGAEALGEAVVCTFARADFERFARDHPRLEHRLLERTLVELDRTRKWMVLLARMDAGQRVASFLLELAERLDPAACGGTDRALAAIELPVSRQQMGDILGLTIETVSRQFTRLREQGIIATPARRSVEIRNFAALAARAG